MCTGKKNGYCESCLTDHLGNCPEKVRSNVVVNLRWSVAIPNEPGWYWWKNHHGTVKIEYVYKHPDRDEICILENTFAGWEYTAIENMGREWAGPIPFPEAK